MTWGTDVIDGGVHRLHTGLADVTDLETSLATLMRRNNCATASTEETLATFSGRLNEARRAAIVARGTLGALTDVGEAITVTVCAVRAEKLCGEAGSVRAVAARGTLHRRGGVVQAVRARWTGLQNRKH